MTDIAPAGRIIDISDAEPIKTSEYPSYGRFVFEEFNPVQSATFPYCRQDVNAVIASRTGSGKTVCAEQFIAAEIRERGGKAIYAAPYRSLVKEKIDDWTAEGHQFADLKIAICTGDYRLTPDRAKELDAADIIVMTCEMLASRCRNMTAEHSQFLQKVGTVVFDEFHLLNSPGRGDHLEVATVKLTEIAPACRVVVLSATMPNVDQIARWVAGPLTQRDTVLLRSKFRPCPLSIHYDEYDDSNGRYDAKEKAKVKAAMDLIAEYEDDIFIAFVHTKKTGQLMLDALKAAGIPSEFHSSDLTREQRADVEGRFRARKLRVLVATSTVAAGVNLPARRVVVLGVHRGTSLVESADVTQMCGRAGRPGLDPRGDAYVLLPAKHFDEHYTRLNKPEPITSRLLDAASEDDPHYKTLAFHLVSDIHRGQVSDRDGVRRWFDRTFARFQNGGPIARSIIDGTLDLLVRFRAITEEDGKLAVTPIGMVASMFYYSPFDTADLRRNFDMVFRNDLVADDLAVALALGNIDSARAGFVSKAEKEEMVGFKNRVERDFVRANYSDPAIKMAYVYYTVMNGMQTQNFTAPGRLIQADFDRTATVLKALSVAFKWQKEPFFDVLSDRVQHGVRRELLGLVRINGIAKTRAERLYAAGFRTPGDILAKPEHAARVMNLTADGMKGILNSAAGLHLVG